jgi:hypothetical protein
MAPLFTSVLRNSLKNLLFSLLVLQLSSSLSILLHKEKGRNSLGLFLVFFSWNFIKEEEVLLLFHGSKVGEFFLLFSSWYYHSCSTRRRRSLFLLSLGLYVTAGNDQSSSLCAFGCSKEKNSRFSS